MLSKEMYRIDVVIGVNGDGEVKAKLSAMEKYAKQTERRMKAMDKIKINPIINAKDRASAVVNKVKNKISSLLSSRQKEILLKAKDKVSNVVSKVKSKVQNLAAANIIALNMRADPALRVIALTRSKLNEIKNSTIVNIRARAEELMSKVANAKGKLQEFINKKYEAQLSLKENIDSQLGGFGSKISSFLSGVARKGIALLTAGSMAVGGFGIGSAVKGFANFEQSMKNVQAVSGATSKEFETLTAKAREMGRTTSFTAKDSADALYYMGMAGWKTKDMLNALPGVLSLASAGGTDLALTSDIVTDGLTALGLKAKDTTMFVDTMAATVTNSNTNIEMMGETFKYVGSMGGALGVSMKDLSLATGLMASASVKGSMAGTALRGGLVRLIKPPAEVAGALKKYGIEISKTKDGNLDLSKTIGTLRDKLGGLDGVTKSQAISSIFGRTAMAGWAAVVNASEEDFNKLSTAIAESEGEAKRIADMKLDTISGQFEILKSAIDDARISIGERLGPITRGFIEKLINDMPKISDAIVGFVEKFVNNFENIKSKIEVLGPAIATIIGGFIALKSAFDITFAIKKFMILCEIFKVTGAGAMILKASIFIMIAAFLVMCVAISNNEQALLNLQNKFGVFGEFVGSVMETVGGIVKFVFGNLGHVLGGLGETIGILFSNKSWAEKGSALKALWKGTWNDMKVTTKQACSDMGAETSTAVKNIRTKSKKELEGVTNVFSTALSQTENVVNQKSNAIAKALGDSIKGLDNESLNTIRGINENMALILSDVTSSMSSKDQVSQITKNLDLAFKTGKINAQDYANGINEALNFINENCANSANNLKQSLSDAFNAFKDGANTGGLKDGVSGMLNTLNAAGPEIQSAVQNLGGQMSQIFQGVDFSSPVEQQVSKILGNLNKMGLEGPEAINALRNGFSEAASKIPDEVAAKTQPTGQKVADAVTQGLPVANAGATQLGTEITNGVTTGLESGIPQVQAKGNELATTAQNSVNQAMDGVTPQINSSGIDQAFSQANTSIQQGATNMYNGAKQSFAKLAEVGRQSGSDLYNGVSTSMNKLATNVKTAASSMYVGARTSFNSLKTSGISSVSSMCTSIIGKWNNMRSVVSKTITAHFNLVTSQSGSSGGGASPKPKVKHAKGGIFNTPHVALFAEEGAEAIIPLNSKRRGEAIGLWQQTGRMLGVNNQVASATSYNLGDVGTSEIFNSRQNNHYELNQPSDSKGSFKNDINIDISVNTQSTDKEQMKKEILDQVAEELEEAFNDVG